MIDFLKYQALIFDMDGTLVDSSEAERRAFSIWCNHHQLDLETVLRATRGTQLKDCLHEFAPHLDPVKEFQSLNELEQTEISEIKEIEAASQFLTLVEHLNLPWGIATSATLPLATKRLNAAEIKIPDILVTAEQIEKGKPDPSHFAEAAKQLKAAPSRCLAFEDSINGINSALSAGCDVVIIGNDNIDYPKHKNIKAQFTSYLPLISQLKEQFHV
ncbi:HAD family hydrolase [Thalassotalea marina]|uniref:Haloacid dehalogenase n=1 Tax=Thalassotalea marina TaxID=1673741 RepID=A0A919BCQ5_9GAMM|nr:HAD-IA family hydrolase [Thalassotalea marina]GHF79323.1 haloacid dehalogenase [Thalassotalea marina]